MQDPYGPIHHLSGERLHHIGRDPRRAEPGGDIGWAQILGLHLEQRRDVALILWIERRRFFRRRQLAAHGAGQVGVGRFPLLGTRIAEHRRAEFGERVVRIALQQFGQVVGIDAADLVQRHRERVGGAGDDRCGRRCDDALAEHRSHAGEAAVEVVVLDTGDQPAIRVVSEGSKVRAAVRLPLLAGLRVGRGGDDGVVDRPEEADEGRVGDAQLHLVLPPRAV